MTLLSPFYDHNEARLRGSLPFHRQGGRSVGGVCQKVGTEFACEKDEINVPMALSVFRDGSSLPFRQGVAFDEPFRTNLGTGL